jgi:hypothetical protein
LCITPRAYSAGALSQYDRRKAFNTRRFSELTVPSVFCDLNFIITAHQETDAYKQHLQQLAGAGAVTFVLSPFHWAEAAEDANPVRGAAKADFMDSLLARWIYERRAIQRKEATAVFFRFLRVQADPPQMIGSVVDVIADLAGVRAARNSRDFVAHLRTIGQDHPLEQTLQQAFDTNRVNGNRFRAGQLDANFLRTIEKLYIQGLLPAQTLVIDEDSKRRFLDGSRLTDFPSFAVESLATYDGWRENRQLSRNNFMDQQHLMALPYVDFFLTDDARLRALVGRISPGLPFRIATLLTKADFDARYPA